MPDSGSEGQERLFGINEGLYDGGLEWLNDLDGMVGYDYSVTCSARKEGRAGKVGFVVLGLVVVAGGLSCGGCGVYFLLAATVVRATGHARQEQDV